MSLEQRLHNLEAFNRLPKGNLKRVNALTLCHNVVERVIALPLEARISPTPACGSTPSDVELSSLLRDQASSTDTRRAPFSLLDTSTLARHKGQRKTLPVILEDGMPSPEVLTGSKSSQNVPTSVPSDGQVQVGVKPPVRTSRWGSRIALVAPTELSYTMKGLNLATPPVPFKSVGVNKYTQADLEQIRMVKALCLEYQSPKQASGPMVSVEVVGPVDNTVRAIADRDGLEESEAFQFGEETFSLLVDAIRKNLQDGDRLV